MQRDHSPALVRALQGNFPMTADNSPVEFSTVCEETGYVRVLKTLKSLEVPQTRDTKVALLFGESNFISMLPVLSQLASVVVIAHRSPSLLQHTQFMLQCFMKADTASEFTELFKMSCANPYLDKYFFLNNRAAFNRCKIALQKVEIAHVQLNLADVKACQSFAAVLTANQARLVLCNFSNSHDTLHEKLLPSAEALLANSQNCLVMHATKYFKSYRTSIHVNLEQYFKDLACQPSTRLPAKAKSAKNFKTDFLQFFYRDNIAKREPAECCYLAFPVQANDAKANLLIQDIIDGKQGINDLSTNLHAHDTREAAAQLVGMKPHWIFKIKGNKDAINRHLRCYQNGKLIHGSADNDAGSVFVTRKIICAYNANQSVTLTRTPRDTDNPLTASMRLSI